MGTSRDGRSNSRVNIGNLYFYKEHIVNDTQIRCTAMQFALEIMEMMDESEVISVSPHDFGVIVKGAEKIYQFLKGDTNE